MKNTIIAVFIFVSISLDLYAQYPNIKVNSSGYDPEEVSIAVNPANPDMLSIGANLNYFYSTTNAGLTWTQKNLTSNLFNVWGILV